MNSSNESSSSSSSSPGIKSLTALSTTTRRVEATAASPISSHRRDDRRPVVASKKLKQTPSQKSSQQQQKQQHHHHGCSPCCSTATKSMYGDLVNALCYTCFLPVYVYLAQFATTNDTNHDKDDVDNNNNDSSIGPLLICVAFLLTMIFSWCSYFTKRPAWSALALLAMCASIAGMNLYQWPHPDEVIVVPQYAWCLIIITANHQCLPNVQYVAWLSLMAAVTAFGVATALQAFDVLPSLVAISAVFFGALFYYYQRQEQLLVHNNNKGSNSSSSSNNNDNNTSNNVFVAGGGGAFMSANAASLVLAGAFCYYASYEIVSMYHTSNTTMEEDTTFATNTGGTTTTDGTTETGYNILRIGFFAVTGLLASGSFQREIEFKKALEIQVAQRSKEIQDQADRLRKVERALMASETAIAITNNNIDSSNKKNNIIVWSNAAFDRLATARTSTKTYLNKNSSSSSSSKSEHAQDELSLWDVMRLSPTDRQILDEMFRGQATGSSSSSSSSSSLASQEIVVNNRFFEVEVTTMEEDKQLSLVVLKEVTEKRARLKAEKKAEREALVSKAMNESMQTLSHELRTPLQGIMGMTSIILEEESYKLPQKVTEELNMVMTSSRLLLTLINNMLDIRKCDAGRMDELSLEPIPLNCSTQEAIDFCRPFATVSNVKLVVGPIKDNVTVQAHALRLQQAMINLLSNSIKYSPEDSSVYVNFRFAAKKLLDEEIRQQALAVGCKTLPTNNVDGPVVVVSVRDEGCGIQVQQKDRLFGRFSQLDGADAIKKKPIGQPSGTGLGLSLCAEFVSRMNGQIWACNGASNGCTFSFYIPLSHEVPSSGTFRAVASPEQAMSNPPMEKVSELMFPKLRILLVDDIKINLKVFRRMLEGLHVGKVCAVESGHMALDLIRKEEFDMVITDVHMPLMSGTELSNTIRRERGSKGPVVVGMTADQSDSADGACRESGMSMVLHKPITKPRLADFLRQFYAST